MAKIKGLHAVLNHVPERLQKSSNRLGDTVSRKVALNCPVNILTDAILIAKVALSVLDSVSVGHDTPVKKLKSDMEALLQGEFAPRVIQALAHQKKIKGFTFVADNVGKVIIFIDSIFVMLILSIYYLSYTPSPYYFL